MFPNTSERAERRGKKQHLLLCLMPQLQIVCLGIGIWGGGLWLSLPVIWPMLIVPLLDLVTGWQSAGHYERSEFTKGELRVLEWNTRFYAIFYMTLLLYLMATLNQLSWMETGFLIGGMGLTAGICFAACHELLHGKSRLDQIIQKVTTAFLFYPHYKLIHIRSHHHHAGTDHDQNTAWLNETIYSYIWRTIPGSMKRCWQLEVKRYANEPVMKRFLKNRMIHYAIGQIILLIGIILMGGRTGLLIYAAHIVVAHIVLESANYIQHYGLMRKKADDKYVKTGSEHSWDTYHYFSSYVTFRVGHHSHHHVEVQPYYLLDPEPNAPKLPVGYFWAIPLVFLPACWRLLVHTRLFASTGCADKSEGHQGSTPQAGVPS